jgi:hypothetical protein
MRLSASSTSLGAPYDVLRGALLCGLCCALLLADQASAALPPVLARAFLDQRIPLNAVSAYVQEIGAANSVKPLLIHRPLQPMNPASTMKLVTTFAGLELLGPDFRWKTEAYADGPIVAGVLTGDLVLKGRGDPKITLEQFSELVARIRATGLSSIRGDLVLDRTWFDTGAYDPGAFDAEPLRPYNVGPDALAVNFKSVRFVFAPNLGNAHFSHAHAAAAQRLRRWLPALLAEFRTGRRSPTQASRPYPIACGEARLRWLLDHPHYVLNLLLEPAEFGGGSGRPQPHGRRPSRRARNHAGFGAALRGSARHQQDVEQPDGPAAFSIAGDDRLSAARDDPACSRGRRALACQAQAQVPRAGNGQRVGPVATRTHRRAEHGATFARSRQQQRSQRVHKLAGSRGH